MRPFPLTSIAGGINRMRIKGNPAPNSLYDLVNAYVTQEGTVVPREGTDRDATLDDTTVGLVAFQGILNVFSTQVEDVPSNYACNVLINPANPADTLSIIWYAQPFMGFLYVVAEFASGAVVHYWLQTSGPWQPDTVYQANQIVTPDTPNGLAYQATRLTSQNPIWAPSTAITEGDIVEPSVANGFFYTATYVAGTNPITGTTEPIWPTTAGGTVDDFGNFQVNQLQTTSTPTTTLSSNITNVYGDTSITATGATSGGGPTIGGVQYSGASSSAGATTPTTATTPNGTVSVWMGGTLYQPGALVIPDTNQGAVTGAIPNGDFASGDVDWTAASGGTGEAWTIGANSSWPQSSYAAINAPGATNAGLIMETPAAVTPGTTITATAQVTTGHSSSGDAEVSIKLVWFDASSIVINSVDSGAINTGPVFKSLSVTGTAPAGAAYVAVELHAASGTSDRDSIVGSLVSWNYVQASPATNLIYQNVQTVAGSSGATEPTWPDVEGEEVTDGGVIWEAVGASIITWTATPIQLSGDDEPTWPTTIGATVSDGTVPSAFAWTTIARNISDPNCPNTIGVVIGASKVYAINGQIVNFSATTNPTDWTSQNDAGFLPTGLQQYGSNPAAVLGLYRGNLMVFNGGGYQMWQIDPDPANMAILDAEPVGSTATRGAQSVANDELFLTAVGVRNVGISGAAGNLQAGTTGQPVDVLIQAELQAGTYAPISLYYPARGQYWLIFGPTAYVLTVNGSNQRSWSRYIFPDTITDWTISGETLYLRSAGNLVWKLDQQALQDDIQAGVVGVVLTAGVGGSGVYYGYAGSATNYPYNGPYGTITPTVVAGVGTIQEIVFTNNGSTLTNFEITIIGESSPPLQSALGTISFVGGNGTVYSFNGETADIFDVDTAANLSLWVFTPPADIIDDGFAEGDTYTVYLQFPGADVNVGVDFSGIIWWPWLSCGTLGLTKELVGFDLIGTGEVNVAIGYDQSNLGSFTPNFFIEAADTVYGQPTPLPVSAPSFSLYLEFSANQAWRWEGANLYINDMRNTG